MNDYMRIGKALYMLFVVLALYALNQASNGALLLGAKYLLSHAARVAWAFVF